MSASTRSPAVETPAPPSTTYPLRTVKFFRVRVTVESVTWKIRSATKPSTIDASPAVRP